MLEVRQVLWFVPSQRYLGAPRFVMVTKVGRVWAEMNAGYRIHKADLYVDGGKGYGPVGRCYLSQEAHEADMKRREMWQVLRSAVDRNWSPPDGVSFDDIKTAALVLKLDEARR